MPRAVGRALTAGVLGAIGLAMIAPIEDLDVWWLLRSGAYMVDTGSFPTQDPFSGSAAGAEWVNHAWSFELLLYAFYRLGGVGGLIALQALFAVATFAVLYAGLRRERVGRQWALVAVAAGALATHGFWSPRPQVVTYLGLAVFWTILRASRDGRTGRLLWLPALTVLWANLHGGFMVGVALIGLCLIGEWLEAAVAGAAGLPPPRPVAALAVAGLAAVAAMFATPFHYRAVLFPLEVMSDRFAQAFISEWGSLPFHYMQVGLVEGLFLLTVVALWASPRRCRVTDGIVLAAFAHLGLQAVRNLPLLVIVMLPILTGVLADVATAYRGRLDHWRRAAPGAVGLLIAGLAVILGIGLIRVRPGPLDVRVGGVAGIFPEGAVQFLERARPAGPLFNDYGWGGYLIWRLYPAYRVSIDGRIAVYGPRRFAEYLEVAEVRPHWRATLTRLGARLVLIKARSPLAVVLKAAPDWQVLYEDPVAVLLGKRESAS